MSRWPTGESTLARAVRIIDAFTPDEAVLTVGTIAQRAGLHVATASRLIAELVEQGLLSRSEDGGVQVGVRLWELAERAAPTLPLRSAALPHLGDLRAVVGQHAQLCVADGDAALCIERLSSPHAIVNYTRTAGRLPYHATSVGLTLLAYGPPTLVDRVLSRELRAYTTRTLVDPARIREELGRIRHHGYCITHGHLREGVTGVSVPVRDRGGRVIAGLSVIVPDDSRVETYPPLLAAAARGIEDTLHRSA